MTNCDVITKADNGNGHRLVRMTLKIKKRLARLKHIKKKLLILTQKFKDMKETFEINLKNIFEKTCGGDSLYFL